MALLLKYYYHLKLKYEFIYLYNYFKEINKYFKFPREPSTISGLIEVI